MNKENHSGYQQAFKAFSILGSIQILIICISVIKSKFIAVFLGASGLGLIGLFQTTIDFTSALTGLGINFSSIRNIAAAIGENNLAKAFRITKIITKLSIILGVIGSFLFLLFAKPLSIWTFGNSNYVIAFVVLSIILLIKSITGSQLAVIQGFRKINYLAKANLWGAIGGVLISILLIYFYGEKGIVPSLIATAFFALIGSYYYKKKIHISNENVSKEELYSVSRNILKIGIMMTISGSVLTSLIAYLLKSYICKAGSFVDVGLYQAAWTILNGYVGIIFSAMGTDYYPRLAEINDDNRKFNNTVNQQIEMSILVLAPILSLLLAIIHWIVPILYSYEFNVIIPLIYLSLNGIFFKAIAFCISYIYVAKALGKAFLISEITSQVIILILSICGYKYWGLNGIGYAFTIGHFIYMLITYFFAKRMICFSFEKCTIRLSLLLMLAYNITFTLYVYLPFPYNHYLPIINTIIIFFISYRVLDNKMDLSKQIKKCWKR